MDFFKLDKNELKFFRDGVLITLIMFAFMFACLVFFGLLFLLIGFFYGG